MHIHNALLSRGYFPRELPPAFTTIDFGNHVDEIAQDWRNSGVFKCKVVPIGRARRRRTRRGSYTYSFKATEAEIISMPKSGFERRNLQIVHPLPQALLSIEIGNNWRSIQKWLSRQAFSEDKIRVGTMYDRSIRDINFDLHSEKKRYLEATSDWVVTTDITRFYPSIYTHSIAWAAYGKERVKGNLGGYKGSLAERIDFLIRSCNRNQTIGIPIGPETSRIVAEVISSRIDQTYMERNPDSLPENINRLQDDWTIGVKSLEDAERMLSEVSRLYRSFGLDINGSKTSIDRIVVERQRAWISELVAFLSPRQGLLAGSRLREFLDTALVLQSQNPTAHVVSYALSIIDNMDIAPSDIAIMESFLLKAATVAPMSLDRICRVIVDLQTRTRRLSAKRIGERFVQLATTAMENGHDFEVIWLLYTLRGLGRPIEARSICQASAISSSSAIALILMDMKSNGLGLGKLPISNWQARITKESILTDWTWLLAYEGIRNGWLSDPHDLMSRSLFEPLILRDVKFYDPQLVIQTSAKAAAARQSTRRLNLSEIRKLLGAVRGIVASDY